MADIFTDVGETLVADYVDGTASAPANNYIGWGTGAGTTVKADTTLFTEASEAREIATRSQPTADANRYVATLTADGVKTITNAAVFDAVTSGNMLLKSDFGGIVLALNDTIQFTFTITWS